MADAVNHPPHYNSHPSGVECITIVEEFNFNIGNAIKYLWRAGLKDAETSEQDLLKAEWYIKREIERMNARAASASETAARIADVRQQFREIEAENNRRAHAPVMTRKPE